MDRAPAKGQPLQGQVIEWLVRLEGAPDDPMLRAEFEGWLSQSDGRRRAYAAVQQVWGTSARLAPLAAARREAARAKRPWHGLNGRRAALAAVAIAACIAFLAVPVLQLRLAADHMTGTAELRDLMLEDGSRVTLDADSAIAVDYTAGRRGVRLLSGQAYFEVTPSAARPFVVMAGAVDVTVTGTAFNVATSSAGMAVAVQSGTVRVSRNGSEALAALFPGQSLKVANGTVSRGAIEPLDVGAWKDRRLIAYDAVLRDIVEQVGRHMPGVIVFADSAIANSRVSGIVDLRRPAEALHALVDLQQGKVTTLTPYLTVISSR